MQKQLRAHPPIPKQWELQPQTLQWKERQPNRLLPLGHIHLLAVVEAEEEEHFSNLEVADEVWAEAVWVEVVQIPLRSTQSNNLLDL
jgi:hypothetical protein